MRRPEFRPRREASDSRERGSRTKGILEQLDLNNPNQRRLTLPLDPEWPRTISLDPEQRSVRDRVLLDIASNCTDVPGWTAKAEQVLAVGRHDMAVGLLLWVGRPVT